MVESLEGLVFFTKSPSSPQHSPSDHDSPMELNQEVFEEMELRIPPPEPIMKTALEVLTELSVGMMNLVVIMVEMMVLEAKVELLWQ